MVFCLKIIFFLVHFYIKWDYLVIFVAAVRLVSAV